uniref:Histidinol-phosphate aminotransferase 1 n=1 Tax=Lygus hesperus TaxID=30085 RepID=A0A0A9WHU2_LYGHE
MNSGFLKTPTLLTVAVGAGVMIGAAGVFLYEHLIKEKRRLILQRDVMNLGMSVTELRREVEELREAQMARRRSRRAAREEHNSTASVSESDVDMMSIVDDEDEFFDFSDAEDYPYQFFPSMKYWGLSLKTWSHSDSFGISPTRRPYRVGMFHLERVVTRRKHPRSDL